MSRVAFWREAAALGAASSTLGVSFWGIRSLVTSTGAGGLDLKLKGADQLRTAPSVSSS